MLQRLRNKLYNLY